MKKGWKTVIAILVAIASSITIFGTVKGFVDSRKTNEAPATNSSAYVQVCDNLMAA